MPATDFRWPRNGTPLLMAILNVTPDSFSDGGRYATPATLRPRLEQLLADGADIIDIGGESTRPGAEPVSVEQELDRVMPAIEQAVALGARVSVDSRHPEVMAAALAAGAAIINDVNALRAPGAIELVSRYQPAVCLMHMQGEPRSMQQQPQYQDVVREVSEFLLQRATICRDAGLPAEKICLDPGFGFGKSASHNLQLLHALPQLAATGYPVLAGLSRKSLIGHITGAPVAERLVGSVALALLAAQRGARVLRVHEVKETKQVLQLWLAMEAQGQPSQQE
ncbi:MAG TPA: dihydropteroate synthase [Permianibacter sp.]|nr:dihydropteroate synthase [Permianibacter sp.]